MNPNRFTDPISIVVSGGTVSVLILRNRSATKDVDYFNLDHAVISELSAAQAELEDRALKGLPRDWINAEMIAFVYNNQGCEHLFENSLQQNVVLFQSPTLRAYVADWKYQIVGKITRAYQQMQLFQMFTPDVDGLANAISTRELNLMDAVYILRYLVEQRQGEQLNFSEMQTWYFYGPALEPDEIDFVNKAYCAIFSQEYPHASPVSITT